ncbi:MAG: hypothetical protein JWN71_4383 [Xanthobacteraceae bacterium]|nr:hypothetical protein [Xanthobacteraceae bacterium]
MKTPLLAQYRGRLSAQQAADGINAAKENAERLHADAQLLFDAERYQSACALAVLSIEESGKPAILRRIATVASDEGLKKIWREYRTHTAKNIAWIVTDLAASGARQLEDLALIVDQTSDHPELLDVLKQLSLYTDCVANVNWSKPSVVVDADMARRILIAAKVLLGRKTVCTPREIELWMEHVGPREDGLESKLKVLHFYEAMIGEGLVDTPIEQVRAFLGLAPPEQPAG